MTVLRTPVILLYIVESKERICLAHYQEQQEAAGRWERGTIINFCHNRIINKPQHASLIMLLLS
jgi:hypothetical protein